MDRVVVLVHGGGQFTPGWSRPSVEKLAHILGRQPPSAEVTYSQFFPHASVFSTMTALLKVLILLLWNGLKHALGRDRAAGARALREPPSARVLRSLAADTERAHQIEAVETRQVVNDLWETVGGNLEESGVSTARLLTREAPKTISLIQFSLDLIGQVASYVCEPNKPGEGDEVQHALREVLNQVGRDREVVLVSHSLGTVVSFDVLREHAREYNITTWYTMGCPLAILASRGLRPTNVPQIGPPGVHRWVNIFDPSDPVTNAFLLSSRLGGTFAHAQDIEIDLALSLPSAHDYLNSWKVMEEVAKAL